MRILLLGGTGAMGKALAPILAKKGNEVYVTSRTEHENENNQIHFILGDAQNDIFLETILNNEFDAIVDFMTYSTDKFRRRLSAFLNSTSQYIYLSSARVYADSYEPINEASNRLLDVCMNQAYLSTDEYGLAKARQENLLLDSGKTNWTIIRPYITYNSNRMQLGVMEKELWLYRALRGKEIIFSEDILNKYTTLTYGGDVAVVIADLICNNRAYGEIYNVMQSEAIKWSDVLDVYLDTIEQVIGERPKILLIPDSIQMGKATGRIFQINYDRLYHRIFDNSKVCEISSGFQNAIKPQEGLAMCLKEQLTCGTNITELVWKFEGYADKLCGYHTYLSQIPSIKDKAKYVLARYTNYFTR